MRLTDWIRVNMEEILQAWEAHARNLLPLDELPVYELRDHAQGILHWIADDMDQPRTTQEQSDKSTSLAAEGSSRTSAHQHGSERMKLGMDALQMTGEFRALRVSVIQLWIQEETIRSRCDFEDLLRFNQALDQVLAESVKSFTFDKARQERLFHTILTSSPDPSYILDSDGRFLYANRATTALYNTTLDQLIGNTLSSLGAFAPESLDAEIKRVIRERTQLRSEAMLGAKEDQHCHEYIHTPVVDSQGKIEAVVGIARDITQRRESEAKIWHYANHDSLTELPNRRLFRDRLEQQARLSERTKVPFAVFFIDLDRFKQVNDLLGHDEGDLLLKQAADRIRQCVRETDTVARLGGDEFTVILMDADSLTHIEKIARNILSGLAKPFYLGDEVAHISGSIGITRYPYDGKKPRHLLKNADQAMYTAKKSGRNQFCFFAQLMEQAATARAQLISELRGALEQQQLHLYYQPIIDLSDGRIDKAEALMRWHNPSRGLLLPGDFLDLAEEAGLLDDIEVWAFSETVAHSKQFNDLIGSPFQVSLNVSSAHFAPKGSRIPWSAQLKKVGLPASGVAVEFTENVFSHVENGLVEALTKLDESGIALAIDDFGMGHSSVVYLKRFNISYLKIPPSFIRSDDADDYGRAIAESVILMAQKLGLKVIAEGVETQEEKDWLKAAGCDYAQGFFFSKPLTAQAFKALLADRYTAC